MTDRSRYLHLDDMAPWNDKLHALEVIDVREEVPEVKTFTFRSDDATWFRFEPGQFVTLELPTVDGPLMRTYTISSSPSRPFSIAVTAKAQAGSMGTRWMFDHLKPGIRVNAYGPTGDFSLHRHPAAKYLFISAGSGVTPMMSMLRWLHDCRPRADVCFVNCSRRPEDIIFRKELELIGGHMPLLSLGLMIEERSSREAWYGHMGRIDQIRLRLLAPDFLGREIFCCGPDPFMRAVRALLEASGFDLAHYHQESFAASAAEELPAPLASTTEVGVGVPVEEKMPVRFLRSDVDAEGFTGQTILQTARAFSVGIPAACEFGVCGTCKVKKLSGKVEMHHHGGILPNEIDDGFILACCSKPLSALEIEA
ncbi:hybrid-cluster NAD(P)-dependent oxidoreductase [Paraburkholderia aspalathi]|uniref:Ferredoxin-NADP reductase n=1 Tax=Paraburkholderia aspalathi TaxID=1324617 RepID=A0A1I7B9B4_9BURK|nr:hybrid-cluster NAD(P)-dependent oxidoreductase [Paraburkholderia aspalathi]SFT83711.1 Ferredoxin-NADP reductase [Paraburkholderia aspalathi]